MRVLVTGASGFVGRQAVRSLVRDGHSVIGAGRNSDRDAPCDWLLSNMLERGEPARIVKSSNAEAVLHLAWTTEHGKFWNDPSNADWLTASIDLAEAAIDCGVKRLVAVGSCYEYAWPEDGDCDELTTPLKSHTPYDCAKSALHAALTPMTKAAGLSFAWARLFHLYGPHERPGRLVSSIARSLAAGEPAECSSGRHVRSFMDSREAGDALARLIGSSVSGPINIASEQPASVADVANTLGHIAGRADLIKLGALADRPNDPPRITGATNRLRNEVGWKHYIDMRGGLAHALDFHRQTWIYANA